jgi:hypothetical protein
MRWLLLSLLLFLAACNTDRIAQLEKQNKELAAKLDAVSKRTTLELQERCAKQARAEFKGDGNDKTPMTGFVNHYNAKLDKCFMEVTNSSSSGKSYVPTIYRSVSEAFEGKVYAEYFWRNDEGKKYWEVPPIMCKVTLLDGEERFCKTTEEYEELIKVYMQQ